MMTSQSPLPQYDVKQSNSNTNDSKRGTQLLHMLPTLLINVVVPFIINMLSQPHMSTINSLLLASSVPALFTLGSLIVKKRIDVTGVIVIVSMLISAAFALLFKSPRLLLLQTSTIMALFGVVMLVSLLFPRPAMFYLVRSMLAQNDPQRFASFNADWSILPIRSFYKTLTVFWGYVGVAQLPLLIVMAFTLPISLMLVLSPILSTVIISLLVHWSRHSFRKNKPIFDQLRWQRDAII